MSVLGYLCTCAIRSRCPCCGRGPIFRGWFALRETCPACGLVFEQWVGDWTTPTWIAPSAGFLGAMGLFVWMFITGHGMNGPVPPAILVAAIAVALSVLLLRPSKAGWLGFLYWVGFVEVSAETRAQLHWFALKKPDPVVQRRAVEDRDPSSGSFSSRARAVAEPPRPPSSPGLDRPIPYRSLGPAPAGPRGRRP